MAEVTASMVKELREKTDAPMMECKKALTEAAGDLGKAEEILRVKLGSKATKAASRIAAEGIVAINIDAGGKTGAIVEVNSETDFVGRNAEFTGFAAELAEHIAAEAPTGVEHLLTQTISSRGITVSELFGEKVSKLGENMGVARFVRESIEGTGAVATYIHGGGKIGVLVSYAFNNAATATNPAFQTFAKDVAMQVAASSPFFVRREDASPETIEHEMSIYKAQAAESGKPEAIQEKMAQGRLEKFYKEVALVEQAFVKNPDQSVAQYAAETGKAVGDEISVVSFERFVLGESSAE